VVLALLPTCTVLRHPTVSCALKTPQPAYPRAGARYALMITERQPNARNDASTITGSGSVGPMEPDEKSLIDRMRDSGVGVEDPNIVGDVGPVDIPPGSDGEALIQEADPDDDRPVEP